jgi:hypothetical protein
VTPCQIKIVLSLSSYWNEVHLSGNTVLGGVLEGFQATSAISLMRWFINFV